MKGWKRGRLILVLLAAGLWACTPETAISPEQAVYLKLSQSPGVVLFSIQVQPAIPWHNQYFVLANYNLNQNDNSPPGFEVYGECTTIFEVTRSDEKWNVFRHITSCSNSASSGFSTDVGRDHLLHSNPAQRFSYVSGKTPLDEARWIEITWKDGTLQRVPIQQNTFFALKDGDHEPSNYALLDENEKVISERTP